LIWSLNIWITKWIKKLNIANSKDQDLEIIIEEGINKEEEEELISIKEEEEEELISIKEEELVSIKEHKERDKINFIEIKTLTNKEKMFMKNKGKSKIVKWAMYFFPNYNSYKKRKIGNDYLFIFVLNVLFSIFN